MKLKSILSLMVIFCIMCLLEGCGILLHQLDETKKYEKVFDMKKKININSTPEGAAVYLNDEHIGNTPIQHNVNYIEKSAWTQKEKDMLTIGSLLDASGVLVSGFFISEVPTHTTASYISIVAFLGYMGVSLVDIFLLNRDLKSEKVYYYEPDTIRGTLEFNGYKPEVFEWKTPDKLKDISFKLKKIGENNENFALGCTKDTDCKGDRVCIKGECQWLSKQ